MTETNPAAAAASSAVLSRLRGMLPDDVPPFCVLHGAECALSYHLRDGLTVNAACWKAAKANMGFEAMPCGWCGEQFLSQRGEEFCTVHCWVQDRTLRDPDTDVTGCGDDCDHCAGDTKTRHTNWLRLGDLACAVEERQLSAADLRHMLRVARQEGVDNDLDEEDVLIELAVLLGPVEANVLVGHHAAVLRHYDQIMVDGYNLADAIQDFMDGKV